MSDKLIDTIDPDGVALAAIQGLHALAQETEADLGKRLAEKDAEIAELRSRQAVMENQLAALTNRLDDQTASR